MQQPPNGYGPPPPSQGYGPQGYGPPAYGPAPVQQVVQVVATKTNVMAMVGFWLTVASYATCGVTAIPGLICCIIGMKEEPKGWAIAGLAVGTPGTLWSLFWVGTFILGLIGAGAGAAGAAH